MPSKRNITQVQDLKERLARSTIVIVTGLTGLNVATMTDFRKKLREKGVEYKVVKNTLIRIATREVGKEPLGQVLQGATGLVLGYHDPVEVAKLVDDYIRTTRVTMAIVGAFADGRLLKGPEVATLASLPPKPQLVGMLASRLVSVMAGLLYTLNAPTQGLATVLQRSAEKAQPEGGSA